MNMNTKKEPLRGIKIFVLAYFIILMLTLTFIGIMDRLGYKMIDMSLEFALFILLVCSALAALALRLIRRFQRGWSKAIAGTMSALLILVLAASALFLFSMMMLYSIPMHYTTLTSPDGEKAVVMRLFSRDMEATAARAEQRRSQENETDEDYALSDLAYSYTAYPRVAHFFYNSKQASDESVEIGCESGAQLMYEWIDGNTLHMYIQEPEAYDKGELMLSFE